MWVSSERIEKESEANICCVLLAQRERKPRSLIFEDVVYVHSGNGYIRLS